MSNLLHVARNARANLTNRIHDAIHKGEAITNADIEKQLLSVGKGQDSVSNVIALKAFEANQDVFAVFTAKGEAKLSEAKKLEMTTKDVQLYGIDSALRSLAGIERLKADGITIEQIQGIYDSVNTPAQTSDKAEVKAEVKAEANTTNGK